MTEANSLASLPPELILDHILPYLASRDVVALGATNHHLSQLAQDDVYWKARAIEDFNFPAGSTARKDGWRGVYRRLSGAGVFLWG